MAATEQLSWVTWPKNYRVRSACAQGPNMPPHIVMYVAYSKFCENTMQIQKLFKNIKCNKIILQYKIHKQSWNTKYNNNATIQTH